MSENETIYTLSADEKTSKVMLYTTDALMWGDFISKEMVRVNTFLRTIKPDYVSIYNAHALHLRESGPQKAVAFRQIHLPIHQVVAFHLMPPASEPRDYDPNEQNRKMEPITALVGPFRFDGLLRISAVTDLAKSVEITRETFLSLYEFEMSLPGMPALGTIRADMTLICRDATSFAGR
ncbi:MAG: hypothetical protein JXA37_13555 [Chloroflexia bacterium]|nr:hypothetical protein [Chloroflexia bacterium]